MVAVGDGLVAWVVRRGVCCELSGTMGWSLGDESGWGARGFASCHVICGCPSIHSSPVQLGSGWVECDRGDGKLGRLGRR